MPILLSTNLMGEKVKKLLQQSLLACTESSACFDINIFNQMNIFPIKACEDNQDETFSEILGFQVLDSHGRILATGENEEEARNAALTALFLSESNPISKKVKLSHKLIGKNTVRVS